MLAKQGDKSQPHVSFKDKPTLQNNFIPFRDSKLTRLLQDSLGGNTSTYLIATLSPAYDCIDESISTLKFSDRAHSVMQVVKKNEYSAQDDFIINKLQKEVVHLKELLQMKKKGNPKDLTSTLFHLREENDRLREIARESQNLEKLK